MFNNKTVLFVIAVIAVVIVSILVLIRVNRLAFRKLRERKNGLYLLFFERVISAAILIGGLLVGISSLGGVDSVLRSLLGGTAIVSAVLAFAAQDVIKDILAGLMISVHKPFEVGNRIELEDGTVGIVKDITMRHVVLRGPDDLHIVIPNSRLNSMSIFNYSYHTRTKAIKFTFNIAYSSDVEKAMSVIRQAVIESEYSIPGKTTGHGMDYAPVYFMAYEDSSLRLMTTVYFEPEHASEVVISDINLRVNHALEENGIEIPYAYINVIHKNMQE